MRARTLPALMALALMTLAVLAVASCGSVQRAGAGPTVPPGPTGTAGSPGSPSPTPSTLSDAALKYRLFAQLGPPVWCDRDLYPVARELSDAEVRSRVDAMRAADPSAYAEVLRHLRLAGDPQAADRERAVYQELKTLQAVSLVPAGDLRAFDYVASTPGAAGAATTRVRGTISAGAAIDVRDRSPARIECPI